MKWISRRLYLPSLSALSSVTSPTKRWRKSPLAGQSCKKSFHGHALSETAFLKISFSETPTEERWILYGRLTVPWVHELRTCWKKNHRTDVGRACIVDLNEVTFIDRNGERLLRMLARDGAQFTASGIYTMRVLDQVTAKSRRNGSAPKSQGEKASPNVDAALALNTCVDAPERKNLRRK
jgi:hypothetical protein